MCISVIVAQAKVLSLDEAREEGNKLAEYQEMVKDQIKTQTLGWTVEPLVIDRSQGVWILYILMANHIFSFYFAKFTIGTSRYANEK